MLLFGKAVYPRWRGEHNLTPVAQELRFGLSPLARGTQLPAPCCAGKTAVYPRWRGEHSFLRTIADWHHGLSPLARGTLYRSGFQSAFSRFIPAGAGNTSRERCLPYPRAVYPRWRGEHRLRNNTLDGILGLSPLARGTRCRTTPVVQTHRFIPAGAGNTYWCNRAFCMRAVYPRWRGEHMNSDSQREFSSGLSPLARGTPITPTALHSSGRFIPAGAGNTLRSFQQWSAPAVYPRWRGEHGDQQAHLLAAIRFIPAGAGNTMRKIATVKKISVYPRWRGEHFT